METFKEAFMRKYPGNSKILQYFEDANSCEFTWDNITKVTLQKYVDYLQQRLSPNTVMTYCTKVKSVLNLYNEEVKMPKGFQKILKIKHDACQHVYLNDNDIKMIIKYHPKTKAEAIVKNWFLIGCFTGARHSDYIKFTSKNFLDGQLQYVSIKTHIKTSIPLSAFLKKQIKENEDKGYYKIRFSDIYFNRILKRICKNAGITYEVSVYMRGKFSVGEKWTFVASHTARRSFATNLFKHGADILTISKLCGHSSIDMTKQYICCGPIINSIVLKYLNSFNAFTK